MAVVLMGKNTMMRKAMRGHLENNPALEKLLPCIKGNVGLVFTKLDLTDCRNKIRENRVAAPLKLELLLHWMCGSLHKTQVLAQRRHPFSRLYRSQQRLP